MKESQFLGTLLPSSSDFQPIIQALREKYQLREVSPEGEPISEIYQGDEVMPSEEFRQEIEQEAGVSEARIPEGIRKIYKVAKPDED